MSKRYLEQKMKTQRNKNIYQARVAHGYLLKDIADYLKIHYATISNEDCEGNRRQKVIFQDLTLTPSASLGAITIIWKSLSRTERLPCDEYL